MFSSTMSLASWGVIRNWTQPREAIGNSSVMRFIVGSAPHLVEEFERGGAPLSHAVDNEQMFLTKRSGLPIAFWPAEWCRSFKHELLPALAGSAVQGRGAAAGDPHRGLHRRSEAARCRNRHLAGPVV